VIGIKAAGKISIMKQLPAIPLLNLGNRSPVSGFMV
jgi:hypothetical protein